VYGKRVRSFYTKSNIVHDHGRIGVRAGYIQRDMKTIYISCNIVREFESIYLSIYKWLLVQFWTLDSLSLCSFRMNMWWIWCMYLYVYVWMRMDMKYVCESIMLPYVGLYKVIQFHLTIHVTILITNHI